MIGRRLAIELTLLTVVVRSGERILAGATLEAGLQTVLWSAAFAFAAGVMAEAILSAMAGEKAAQIERDEHRHPEQTVSDPRAREREAGDDPERSRALSGFGSRSSGPQAAAAT